MAETATSPYPWARIEPGTSPGQPQPPGSKLSETFLLGIAPGEKVAGRPGQGVAKPGGRGERAFPGVQAGWGGRVPRRCAFARKRSGPTSTGPSPAFGAGVSPLLRPGASFGNVPGARWRHFSYRVWPDSPWSQHGPRGPLDVILVEWWLDERRVGHPCRPSSSPGPQRSRARVPRRGPRMGCLGGVPRRRVDRPKCPSVPV